MQVVHKSVPTKSRRFCSVPHCSSYCTKDVSLHNFPKDPKLCQKWKDVLQIGKPISKFMSVCSKHFLKIDFMPVTPHTVLKRLKRGIVPSQTLPVRQHDQTQTKKHGTNRKWRKRDDGDIMELDKSTVTVTVDKQSTESFAKSKQVLEPATQTDYYDILQLPQLLTGSSPVKIEVKEENVLGNDYLMAKGRLKGVLKQLTERSSDEESESSEDNKKSRSEANRKRKNDNMPTPYHHTYVMKLFDRSVDLARFQEDTPLYPICRAWMQNQPRNPQPIVKRRMSSPEPDNSAWNENSISDVARLPPPTKAFDTRIPSPIPEQTQNKDNINLNYDECPVVEKNELICGHLQRWVKVKKRWIETAAKNEERYARSTHVLQAIYNKAQENME